MHGLRALSAVGLVLVTGIAAASCSGSETSPPSPAAGGAGGAGGADASVAGSAGAAGEGTGGAGTGGTSADAATDAMPFDAGPQPDPRLCGNKAIDLYEDCDDGNKTARDGCENNCRFTCTATQDSLCQDGIYCNGRETCTADHQCGPSAGNTADGTICGKTSKCLAGSCEPAAKDCGDTLIIPPDEECDPPDPAGGCGADCRFICVASDGTRNCVSPDPCAAPAKCNDVTHLCDTTGTAAKDLDPCAFGPGTGKACVAGVCTDKYCSNRKVDPGEECDDGNRVDGDGCDKTCKYSCDAADTARDCHSTNACVTGGACQSTHKCSPDTPKTAGTACGTKQNCVQGNCVTPVCGDGFVAVGVEACDDGNAVDGDGCDKDCTRSCVNALTDCPSTPECRTAVCINGKCDSTPDASKDTTSCGGGAATCHQGACTAGTCGNGTKEAGEQCDDNNLTAGDGCEPNCTFTCASNADCTDGDPCNGVETCDTAGTHKCTNPTNSADGTACTFGGASRICVGGSCRPQVCGDGVVSGSEGCDPPNTAGCDSACKARAICNLTGTWAMKVSANVTWGDDAALVADSGVIQQWAKLSITQTGLTFTATLKPCGLEIPDFQTTPGLFGETYGLTFPNAAFDQKDIPTFPVSGNVSSQLIGATFDTASTAILLGTKVPAGTDPVTATWPADATVSLAPFTLADQDDDALPGITAQVKQGGSYSNILVYVPTDLNLANAIRSDNMYVMIRQISAQTGTVNSCDNISGTTTARIENHIIGCSAAGLNRACASDEWALPDFLRPLYQVDLVKGATFTAQRITGATCAAVRSAVP